MSEQLFNHMKRFVSLSLRDEELLESHLGLKTVHKKEPILSPGEVCQANYFVTKGCLRMYFVKETGQEHTIHFALENWWMTDFTSFENRKPTSFYIQAIEETDLLVLTRHGMEALSTAVPQLERYLRLIAERAFAASLLRIQYLFELSVESRYEQFNSRFPEFVQRIPQYMLANFLGFTPEVLSKIRAKKSRPLRSIADDGHLPITVIS